MPRGRAGARPPRAIAPGDIVACFSDDVGEWTAAQITDLNPSRKTAGVLDLDWSGPEPASVEDLGHVSPLALTHHGYFGLPSHTNNEWVLPRSYKVIGSLPLLRTVRSDSYSSGWDVGMQLALQRRWDRGDRESKGRPGEITVAAPQLEALLAEHARASTVSLRVEDVEALDCGRIVEALPGLRRLALHGKLGRLGAASHLNRLSSLRALTISNLFGMTRSDCLLPERVPTLEWLVLHSVPRDYGAAMRSAWRPELPKGCLMEITALRQPEWLAENLDNPLREWDGRGNISAAKFRKSVAQYRATRRAVLAALAEPAPAALRARLVELGREYGAAFNVLSRGNDFIETEEREELLAALMAIPAQSGLRPDEAATAGEWLADGVDEVRDW